jgi:hypothetical protein
MGSLTLRPAFHADAELKIDRSIVYLYGLPCDPTDKTGFSPSLRPITPSVSSASMLLPPYSESMCDGSRYGY